MWLEFAGLVFIVSMYSYTLWASKSILFSPHLVSFLYVEEKTHIFLFFVSLIKKHIFWSLDDKKVIYLGYKAFFTETPVEDCYVHTLSGSHSMHTKSYTL